MGDAVVAGHESPYGIHLVLHQGDERGDHDGRPGHEQRGKLIAEGLPSTRRHEHEGVVSGDEMAHDLLLVGLEGVEPEEFLQLGVYGSGIYWHVRV